MMLPCILTLKLKENVVDDVAGEGKLGFCDPSAMTTFELTLIFFSRPEDDSSRFYARHM